MLPIGRAAVVREGRHLTVVANQTMVLSALEAADALAAEGIELEVIDVRTISPLDTATISESVRRTGRLIVAHEANRTGGWGAEVVARVADADFHYLDAPLIAGRGEGRADPVLRRARGRGPAADRGAGRDGQEAGPQLTRRRWVSALSVGRPASCVARCVPGCFWAARPSGKSLQAIARCLQR